MNCHEYAGCSVVNDMKLFSVDVDVFSDLVTHIGFQSFECVSAMGIVRPPADRCIPDVYDGIALTTGIATSNASCCEECYRTHQCTGCSFRDDACYLLRDGQDDELPASATIVPAQTRVSFLSKSGCDCQPTFFPDTNTSAICYQMDAVDTYGCAIDPSASCVKDEPNATWDYCNGTDGIGLLFVFLHFGEV